MFFLKSKNRQFEPMSDRGPLNVMFLLSSMPVGGAETLLVNLVRRMSDRFRPQICCLKDLGALGEEISSQVPTHHNLIKHKYDLGVIGRLKKLFIDEEIDAVVTVGAGDKMFWGRIAADRARVPVILSALHSTGWPDGIGKLNRTLTSITDRFIAVAKSHGEFLVDFEKFPAKKVTVIPNGVDTDRFERSQYDRQKIRREFGFGEQDPVIGIIAALRSEKNHMLFLRSAAKVSNQCPNAQFLIVGDGPERPMLESAVNDLELGNRVVFTGSRPDIPELLSAIDVFGLTSRNEASPVSIMEAMSMEIPVVAPDVGSVAESVIHEQTGFVFSPGDADAISDYWLQLINDREMAKQFGVNGRELILEQSSLDVMVEGYERLISNIYSTKVRGTGGLQDESHGSAVLASFDTNHGEVLCD